MFDEEFAKNLPQDSLCAIVKVCNYFIDFENDIYESFGSNDTDKIRIEKFDEYMSAYVFLELLVEAYSLDIDIASLDGSVSHIQTIEKISVIFRAIDKDVRPRLLKQEQRSVYEEARAKYAPMFGKGISYEFSDSDFDKIQGLLNNLRELLTKSDDLEENHRSRLLKRLEELQSELHKKMSNFDKFWGFAVDSSFAFHKVWENSKPFIDDVKEIMQIVCHVQSKTENVQKSFPLNSLLKSADDGEAD